MHQEFEDVLRFWFDRGADGVRIDSAALLIKDPALADFDQDEPAGAAPVLDRDEVHEVYRAWRRIADSYPQPRALIGEVWLPEAPDRFALYLRPDELHTSFNFDFLGCPWDAAAMRKVIDDGIALHAPVGAPATWVLSNHDVVRHVTRYGRADTRFSLDYRQIGRLRPTWRWAPAAPARPSCCCWRCPARPTSTRVRSWACTRSRTIPDELRQDPMFWQTNGVNPGRDGCRVPLPWSGDEPPFGFSPDDAAAAPWLPQPDDWRDYTVAAEQGDPHSMLELYREALQLPPHPSRPGRRSDDLARHRRPNVLAFSPGRRRSSAWSTCPTPWSASRPARSRSWPAGRCTTVGLPRTRPSGSGRPDRPQWTVLCRRLPAAAATAAGPTAGEVGPAATETGGAGGRRGRGGDGTGGGGGEAVER